MISLLTSGFVLAILAHAMIGASLVWDKVLLGQPKTGDIINYVFWLGAISIFGLLLMPFGFHMPGMGLALFAFSAGVIHLIANYFYYATLKSGEASQTLAVMGGISPLATFLVGLALLPHPYVGFSGPGFALMVAGGFLMFLSEPSNFKQALTLVLLSAFAFGLTNVMEKMAFDRTNFVSAYVLFTLGTFAGSMFFLVRSSWRRRIFAHSQEASPRSRAWYFVNRFVSGVGSFLIFLAISRAHPAIVSAVAGLRYAIVFAGAFLITRYHPQWLRERFSGWGLVAKTIATLLIISGLVLVGLKSGSNT